MKQRPRFAENKIAELLSVQYRRIGLEGVERIPVTGRTGPDLTWQEELPLIVDVKSRLSCPKGYWDHTYVCTKDHWGVEIQHLDLLYLMAASPRQTQSKMVDDWLKHMDKWRVENYPSGISAIVLHRPRLPYGKAMLIISKQDRRRFEEIWTKQIQSR